MRNLPPLNALKAFEAAGRHLTFRHAADELGVTQGAVAQHVRALEAQLQVKLFDRHARGLGLTDEGRRFLPSIQRAFDLMADATQDLAPREEVVTISTTPSFATRWLVPRLGDLSSAHPELRVRIDASNSPANFQSDGVDIAVRQGKPPFPGLTSTLLFSSDLIAVCHPDFLQGLMPIKAPHDLDRYVLLQDAHGLWPLFLQSVFTDGPVPDMKMMNFNQTSLAIDAAIAGQGVALTSRAFVETELRQNRLCQPFPDHLAIEDGFYVVSPRKPRRPKVVRQLHDWLTAQT
ncbi:LysR substrate-binding domain-containing protein [uncultured Pelagimonas sp.]|uniref:LysR substrate-binding domain-containing protein n=1 Tax=uncultured Pelagimonas sp. TaxID=1618102 RepID=UPI002625EB1E|nr:LysR substrate-binding domain-containing protein [uncultured Pelagimonas sp.]